MSGFSPPPKTCSRPTCDLQAGHLGNCAGGSYALLPWAGLSQEQSYERGVRDAEQRIIEYLGWLAAGEDETRARFVLSDTCDRIECGYHRKHEANNE